MIDLNAMASPVVGREAPLPSFPADGTTLDDVGPNPEAILYAMVETVLRLRPKLTSGEAGQVLRAVALTQASKLLQPAPTLAKHRNKNVMWLLHYLVELYNAKRPAHAPLATMRLVGEGTSAMYPGSMVLISFGREL